MLLGSIEAGGTKFVCAVGNEDFQIKDQITFPTTTPEETLGKAIKYFQQYNLDGIGIASFGPIEIRANSKKYGYITNTPKKGWQNVNFLGEIKANFDCPVTWTTDVNGSAFGEYTMSMLANEHINSLVYYTIGTGVGAGVVINGKFLETQGHSEMGHVYLKRHPKDLNFKGICPYHGDCLEGLVAGPTFEARTGKTGKDVQINDPVWNIMSFYVAQAAIQTTLSFRPNKIIFGGGVVNELFLQKIRRDFAKLLNEYVSIPNLEKYITMPLMANNGSATLGNFALASKAYHS